MPTIADFNRTVNQLNDLGAELGIRGRSAKFNEEERDDGEGDREVRIVNILFDHAGANPLTLDATDD